MSKDKCSPPESWRNFCNSMANAVGSMTDAEILEEAREQGLDLRQETESIRSALRACIANWQADKEGWRVYRDSLPPDGDPHWYFARGSRIFGPYFCRRDTERAMAVLRAAEAESHAELQNGEQV